MLWIKILTGQYVMDQNSDGTKCCGPKFCLDEMSWIQILTERNVMDQNIDGTKFYGSKY